MKIIIDHRETRSGVVEALGRMGAQIEMDTLEVGDYVVSDRVAFERKTVDDLFSTLLERRELFSQLADLAKSYRLPILIIEGGDPFFFSGRLMHPAAVQGFLNTIALMRVPTLYTLNEVETAQVIINIAKKEQTDNRRSTSLHGNRHRMSLNEAKEYALSSIPGIGPIVARNLLLHFRSVENVITAPREELMKVERIGGRIAGKIRELSGGRYERK